MFNKVFFLQEIYKDRKKFSKQVFDVASSDLVNMGICVVSYTLKDIRDEEVMSRKKNSNKTCLPSEDSDQTGQADTQDDLLSAQSYCWFVMLQL